MLLYSFAVAGATHCTMMLCVSACVSAWLHHVVTCVLLFQCTVAAAAAAQVAGGAWASTAEHMHSFMTQPADDTTLAHIADLLWAALHALMVTMLLWSPCMMHCATPTVSCRRLSAMMAAGFFLNVSSATAALQCSAISVYCNS
jgi:hypothetical protein